MHPLKSYIQNVPRLVRVMNDYEEHRRKGQSTERLEEDFKQVQADPAEVALGVKYLTDLDRAQRFEAVQQTRFDIMLEQCQRTDLTQHEAFELCKALGEETNRIEALAKRYLKAKKERFGSR